MRIAIAGDHGGFQLKESLTAFLRESGHQVLDLGAASYDPLDDYPDFALPVARAVAAGQAERGIIVCGSGAGASIAANKVRGVRAATCHDTYTAHQGVEHDDMNVLCLGARVVGAEVARELVAAFLSARFRVEEERFVRRLNKVKAMEAGIPDKGSVGGLASSTVLIKAYKTKKQQIEKVLAEITARSLADPFRELQYCILTPMQGYEKAQTAMAALRPSMQSIHQVAEVLRQNGIRFHNNKAERLLEARSKRNILLQAMTDKKNDDEILRDWLHSNFSGIGMKEATHFLRNIGRAQNMAMLDSWVTSKMVDYGVLSEKPKYLSSSRVYKQVERTYLTWASELGIPPRHLDRLLWREGREV